MPRHTQRDISPITSKARHPNPLITYALTYTTQQMTHRQWPRPTDSHHNACTDIRSMADIPHSTHHDRYHCNLRMPGHTQRNRYPTDNGPHRSTCTITHVRTYTAQQIPRSQQPPPDIIATCVCADIRNRTKDGGTDTRTRTDTGTTASPDKRHAIDHLDRGIRRITPRVWRAAAPRRPRSSSTRAG